MNNISWKKCVGIYTDGVRAMSGAYTGLLIEKVAPYAKWTYCIIHREPLAAKNMDPELDDVLNVVVNTVNSIKAQPLKYRMFKILCEGMGSEQTALLFHTEARWLSREERCQILIWTEKVQSFMKKLSLYECAIKSDNLYLFPNLQTMAKESEINIIPTTEKTCFVSHINTLQSRFAEYFYEGLESLAWIRNPFKTSVEKFSLNMIGKENLIDLQSDTALETIFKENSLASFWISVQEEYPFLSESAINILIPFATTYLCETGFSTLAAIDSKYRTRLDVTKELRVALSEITPRFNNLCAEKKTGPTITLK